MIFSATMLPQNLLPNALTIFCTIFALQVFEEALKLATTSYELRVSCNIRVVNFLRDVFCVPFSVPLLRQKTSRVYNTSVYNGSRVHNCVALKHFVVNRRKKKTSSRISLPKTWGAFYSTQLRKFHVPNGTVHSGGREATVFRSDRLR